MTDENDDILNSDEIEALLSSAGGGTTSDGGSPAGKSEPQTRNAVASGDDPDDGTLLDAGEIEALLDERDSGRMPGTTGETSVANAAEQLLRQAEADLAAAVAPQMDSLRGIPPELGTPAPFQFRELGNRTAVDEREAHLGALQDVELDLRIELGRTELLIEEVLKLKEGSVVPLDKLAGDPVDILVNGRLIARGEVLVLNDNFCVRIAEILTPDF